MSPALLAATATMVPTVSTPACAPGPTQPAAANTEAVASRVTSVMPEVGCEDTPTMPTMRAATVTNSTPNTPTPAARTARCSALISPANTPGTRPATSTTKATPPSTRPPGRSRSVRSTGPAPAPPLPRTPRATATNAPAMVGSPRSTVRMPAVATAPAPM